MSPIQLPQLDIDRPGMFPPAARDDGLHSMRDDA